MERARTLKPSFFKNEKLVECTVSARLLYVGLWLICDRHERVPLDLDVFKQEVFPKHDVDIQQLLDQLAQVGLIQFQQPFVLLTPGEGRKDRGARLEAKSSWLYRHRRRVRMREAKRDLTPSQWQQILSYFGQCCAYYHRILKEATADHVVPVSRHGDHTAENVIPACRRCNSRKGTRTILEFVTGFRLNGGARA